MNAEQRKTLHQELLDKLLANDSIQKLITIFNSNYGYTKLVGGAIVDILDGRTPKDYDIIAGDVNKITK